MRATSESVPWYPGSNPVAARRYTTTTASRNPNDAANTPLMTSCRAARGTPPRRQENHASGGTRRMRFTHQGSATSPVIMKRFYRESRQISSRKMGLGWWFWRVAPLRHGRDDPFFSNAGWKERRPPIWMSQCRADSFLMGRGGIHAGGDPKTL